MHEQCRVAAVVEDHVRALAVAPVERAVDVVPVFHERLALVSEYGRAARRDRRCRMILGREHVAARPTHLRAERLQRLDQNRGLDRHVQRAGDARALQRLLRAELGACCHEPRHLVLGELDFLAAIVRERDVLDEVVSLFCGAKRPCLLSHFYLLFSLLRFLIWLAECGLETFLESVERERVVLRALVLDLDRAQQARHAARGFPIELR